MSLTENNPFMRLVRWPARQDQRIERRRLRYHRQILAKVNQYNTLPPQRVEAETRRLIRVARTINPRRHLRRVSYEIKADLGKNYGGASPLLKRITLGPQASSFTIAHELGHLLPGEKPLSVGRVFMEHYLGPLVPGRKEWFSRDLQEEARASRHALRILKAAGYKDSALRRMRAEAMTAYETFIINRRPLAAHARIMRNPIARLYPPHKRKRARHLYDLLRKGRAQKVVALGKALLR